MNKSYIFTRLTTFVIIVWLSSSVIFILPHLAPGRNPVRERIIQQSATGSGRADGIEDMVAAFERDYGLDKPLWIQYITYMGKLARFDLGTSLALYPAKVSELIMQALPWTVGLLGISTLFAFGFGSLAGALLAWPRAPGFVQWLFPPLMVMSSVPYFLLGIFLMTIFAFMLKWIPICGGSSLTSVPAFTFDFIRQIIHHAILPGLSVILSGIGFWSLSMRGMMITVAGEDYVNLAEMRGLSPRRIFFQYAMRNAILPQITALALALGFVVSGLVLVEWVFRYPGIGSLLFKAIAAFDYFLIYGVVFVLILGIALTTLVLDLIYPLLDPRIKYERQ